MANGRGKRKTASGRESGGFVALPWSVLDSPSYARLSHVAKSLLLEIARQFVFDNNGRLLCSRNYLSKRGWRSNDTINRAKRELLDGGFIYETVRGHRPNRASWYALTWQTLDKLPGYDAGVERGFQRGAYASGQSIKNASLTPPHGTAGRSIAPPHGAEGIAAVPPDGAIRPDFAVLSVPPDGHHLEVPSAGERVAGAGNQARQSVRTVRQATV